MRSAQLTTSPSGVDGCRARPGVVADAVEGLLAQVEGRQRHVGAPGGVVEAARDVGGEGVLAGVAAGAVPAVVPEGDGLGQRHVEPAGPGDAGGHLGHLEGVGEPGALVVVGEDEDLGLAGQPPERRRVQDPVAVALEAGAPRVGLLGSGAVPGALGLGGARGQLLVARAPRGRRGRIRCPVGGTGGGPAVGVGEGDPVGAVAGHGGRPATVPLGLAGARSPARRVARRVRCPVVDDSPCHTASVPHGCDAGGPAHGCAGHGDDGVPGRCIVGGTGRSHRPPE